MVMNYTICVYHSIGRSLIVGAPHRALPQNSRDELCETVDQPAT